MNTIEPYMGYSDWYDEEIEDSLIELDGQIHDNLHYALSSLKDENKSEAEGHIAFVDDLIEHMKDVDVRGVLEIWNEYAERQQEFLNSLQERIEEEKYREAIEVIDKMVFLQPAAFDEDNPNHLHPDEWRL